jgi:hypothetical protein
MDRGESHSYEVSNETGLRKNALGRASLRSGLP